VKVLVDMNLSPSWVPALENHGFSAIHWSSVGDGQGALITIDEARLRSRILPLVQ